MPRAGGSSGGSSPAQADLWGSQPAVPHAPTSSPAPTSPVLQDVGSFGVDVSSPQGLGTSMGKNVQQSQNMIEGLTAALFGTHGQGGVPIISDIAHGVGYATSFLQPGTPIGNTPIGSVAQMIGNIPGGIGTAVGGAASIVGGALEHVPSVANILTGGQAEKDLNAQFDAMPDSPAKQQALKDIAAGGSTPGHVKSEFLRANLPEKQKIAPQLFAEATVPSGSFADDLSNAFGLIGSTTRLVERPVAGMAKLSTGLDRLQEIEAVHNGASYTGLLGSGAFSGGVGGAGSSGNTPVEELAYQKWKDGTWTKNQALDFLTASGAGYSHDPGLELAGAVALDPQVWGSIGAAGLSRLGVAGLKLTAATADAAATLGAGAAQAVRLGGANVSRLNVLARLAKTEQATATVRALGETVYAPIANNALGRAAKIMRTIVDPLHAIGGNKVIPEATVDIASEAGPKVMALAHGPLAATQALEYAQSASPELLDAVINGASTYSANVTRAVLMKLHVATMMVQTLGRELIGKNPGEILQGLLAHAPKEWPDLVKTEMVKVRNLRWDDTARTNLGERMASMYGGKTAAEFTADLSKMSPDTLGYLHAVTYGSATGDFLDTIGKASQELGQAGADEMKLPRLILMNEQTLTDVGAQGMIAALKDVTDTTEAARLIRAWQKAYPELNYVQLDAANLSRSVERFQYNLAKQIADGELPAQLLDAQLAKMPQVLQDFVQRIHGAWNLGFRPSDELMMGLKTDGEGLFVPGRVPWVDHVAVSNPAYRGTWAMAHNVAGMPIIGERVGKALDYMEAGAQALTSSVSSSVITAAARSRFVTAATARHPELSPAEAKAIFTAIGERAGLEKIAVRGLSSSNMWDAARALVPDQLGLTGKMTPRDLMTLVVDAYEGDLRFVGLTQKFTGRVKTWLAAKSGSNFAGQFSENLYQKVRFKYNPLFQIQERIEPWVLNGQRGVNFALGTKLTENDRRAALIYDKMRATGLMRASDIDNAEMSAQALVGTTMTNDLGRFAAEGRWAQLRDVRGAKRLNELRTFSHDMGKVMRASTDAGEPGLWDRLVAHYSAIAGYAVSDDEAALRRITEGALGGDVRVSNLIEPGASFADFKNAISPGEWHVPVDIGELKSLDLEYLAKSLAIPLRDGTTITSIKGLRAALADPSREVTMDRVTSAMNSVLSAHPDYTRRVENALNFHWDDFWRQAAERYSLVPAESKRLQLMFQETARLRHMTPVEYVSQVWSPLIKGGKKAGIEEMGKAVSVLRAPAKNATSADLIRNLADVYRTHLDPSAQNTLIQHFAIDNPAAFAPVNTGDWTATHTQAFADRVMERLKSGQDKVVGPVPYARFGSNAAGNATVPTVFKSEPGYVYRTVDEVRVASDWRVGEYAAVHPATIYANGDRSVVLRTKEGTNFQHATAGVNAGDNRIAINAIPADQVEVLDSKGKWVSAPAAGERAALPPVNPDVERSVRYFSKWAKATLEKGMLAKDPNYAAVLKEITGIPTDNAVPYNEMHQLLVNQVGTSMRRASEDAFRLQYFARDRSFIERSINHPFFGIYPASYMWGKVLPELVRFMAREPFGVRTGAAAAVGIDVAKAVAIQREFDPNFDKMMEAAGHSSIAWMLGYLMPALPWDVGSAASTWSRDLATQGLDNQLRVDAGLAPKPIDLFNPIKRISDYISPLRSAAQTERVITEASNVLWPKAPPVKGPPKLTPQGGGSTPPLGPTAGTDLGPVLADEMSQLQAILAGQ